MLKWNRGGNTPTLNMKNYLILKDTMAAGLKVYVGDIVELNEDIGNQLVGYHKAEETTSKPKTKSTKVDRSVGLESSDAPAPKTRAKK